jgi:hypothetical protein
VVDLMTALRQSLGDAKPAPKGKKAPKRAEGQREMLLPISGKKAAKETAKETTPAKKPAAKAAADKLAAERPPDAPFTLDTIGRSRQRRPGRLSRDR